MIMSENLVVPGYGKDILRATSVVANNRMKKCKEIDIDIH